MTIQELIEASVDEIEKMDDEEELKELLREIWHADHVYFVNLLVTLWPSASRFHA